MNLVRRKGQVVYEDLLRELDVIEQRLLPEDSGAAMSLMVLEAKLRERFQQFDRLAQGRTAEVDDASLLRTDISALIPRDLPCYSDLADVDAAPLQVRTTAQTVAVAAVLALITASAVFGLATALQTAVNWLA